MVERPAFLENARGWGGTVPEAGRSPLRTLRYPARDVGACRREDGTEVEAAGGTVRPLRYRRLTISLIHIGAKGEVQPFDTG